MEDKDANTYDINGNTNTNANTNNTENTCIISDVVEVEDDDDKILLQDANTNKTENTHIIPDVEVVEGDDDDKVLLQDDEVVGDEIVKSANDTHEEVLNEGEDGDITAYDEQLLVGNNNNNIGIISTPKKSKKYPTRQNRVSILKKPKTPKLKAARRSSKVKVVSEQVNLGVLRAENVVLRHSLTTLQEAIVQQASEISGLKEEMGKMNTNLKTSIKTDVSACEQRLVAFYSDQDKNCTAKKKQLSLVIQRKLDKISSKADLSLRLAQSQGNTNASVPPLNDILEEKVNNLGIELEKLNHEIATMGDHMDELTSNDSYTPFTFTSAEAKRKRRKKKQSDNNNNSNNKSAVYNNESTSNNDSVHTQHIRSDTDQEHHKTIHVNKNKSTIMFCDSNKKFLVADQLWRGLKIIPCDSLSDLESKISNTDFTSVGMVVIHVGVNDTDKKSGQQVFDNMINAIENIEAVAPAVKIVVSELTPRNDKRDSEVQACNLLMKSIKNTHPYVTMAHHNNLRNSEWSFYDDVKHLSQISIAKFASNLKSAFREALGISNNKQGNKFNNRVSYGKKIEQKQDNKSESLEAFKADLLSKLTSFLCK